MDIEFIFIFLLITSCPQESLKILWMNIVDLDNQNTLSSWAGKKPELKALLF